MTKPKQKFDFDFQNDISIQLEQMTTFPVILCNCTILPVSFVLLKEYKEEFVSLFKNFGKFLAEWIEKGRGGVKEGGGDWTGAGDLEVDGKDIEDLEL